MGTIIPISTLHGESILERSSRFPWFFANTPQHQTRVENRRKKLMILHNDLGYLGFWLLMRRSAFWCLVNADHAERIENEVLVADGCNSP